MVPIFNISLVKVTNCNYQIISSTGKSGDLGQPFNVQPQRPNSWNSELKKKNLHLYKTSGLHATIRYLCSVSAAVSSSCCLFWIYTCTKVCICCLYFPLLLYLLCVHTSQFPSLLIFL